MGLVTAIRHPRILLPIVGVIVVLVVVLLNTGGGKTAAKVPTGSMTVLLTRSVVRSDPNSPRPATKPTNKAAVSGTSITSATATFPSFVTQGLTLDYYEDLYSGYIAEHVVTTVNSVTPQEVSATTSSSLVGTPAGLPDQTETGSWQCSPVGLCTHGAAGLQFWIDPSAPTASISGQGLTFQYYGERQITDTFDNNTQYTVGWLGYTSADDSTIDDYYFDPSTGLVIEHDEKFPGGNLQLWYTGGGPG